MYCKYCGEKIKGTENFCNKCGKKLKNNVIHEKESLHKSYDTDTNKRLIIIIIILTFISLSIIYYLSLEETRSVPYQDPYQDPVYKTYYYQEPIYRTDYYQDPIYRTENYQEPIYGSLYSGTLGRINYHLGGIFTDTTEYTINNAISTFWTGSGYNHGNNKYTVYVCWSSSCQYYYDIEYSNLQQSTGITGYETKSRQVIDHYETKSRDVIDRYETKSKDVIDHYETKYQTKYRDMTKTRWEWILQEYYK